MSIIGRFTSNVPRVVGRAWSGGVDREVWNWMRKVHDSVSKTTSQLIEIFGTPGGALQGLLTTKGDLLGFDSAPTRVPVESDGKVLTADSLASFGVSWKDLSGAQAFLLDGCVSSWRLEEASGTRRDAIGRDGFNDLSDVNTVAQAAGKIGNSALFAAASSERLSILDTAQHGLNPGLYDLAVSLWFYPIGTTGNALYGLLGKGLAGGGADAEGYRILITGTTYAKPRKVSVGFCDSIAAGGVLTSSLIEEYTLNAWNHVFVYWDRDGLAHVYLNGAKITGDPAFGGTDNMSTVTGDCSPAAAFALACISSNGGSFSNFYDGRIDATQVFVFPTTVPNIPALAAALWNNGAGRELSPLWSVRDNWGFNAFRASA